jgi:hypothetical protein
VLAREDVQALLTAVLQSAEARVQATVLLAHRAGSRLGTAALIQVLSSSEPPGSLPPPQSPQAQSSSLYLEAVRGRVSLAFQQARGDLEASVRAAHGSLQPPPGPPQSPNPSSALAALRAQASRVAFSRAVDRLALRSSLSASVSVQRGYSESQLTAARLLASAHPDLLVTKTWRSTSAEPCPFCVQLSGLALPLDQPFPAAEPASGFSPPAVFHDLQCPPRHPNCRCRLVISVTAAPPPPPTAPPPSPKAPTPVRDTLSAPVVRLRPPTSYSTLSAAQVRSMPEAKYSALVSFFSGAAAQLKRLLGRPRAK